MNRIPLIVASVIVLSTSVLPSMRAPRFEEAAFSVTPGEAKRVSVVVDR